MLFRSALYLDAQTKTPAFVFALVALIDFISRWFYQDQINKALQRLTMLTELSGISLPELLTEPVSEETNRAAGAVIRRYPPRNSLRCYLFFGFVVDIFPEVYYY